MKPVIFALSVLTAALNIGTAHASPSVIVHMGQAANSATVVGNLSVEVTVVREAGCPDPLLVNFVSADASTLAGTFTSGDDLYSGIEATRVQISPNSNSSAILKAGGGALVVNGTNANPVIALRFSACGKSSVANLGFAGSSSSESTQFVSFYVQ